MPLVVLVTGGSRGIGAACVEEFHRAGHRVAFGYHQSEQQAREIADHLPGVMMVRADLCDCQAASAMVCAVQNAFGHIDVLVNNAGISHQKLFTDVTDEEYDAVMATNVKSVFACSRAVLPGMIARKTGCIVNISSRWGQVGASCEVIYSASKAAVIGMTKALAKEVGPSGIRVNCIAPGVIDTDMNRCLNTENLAALRGEIPLGRIGSPLDVARCALFLADEPAAFITGQVIGVNGGMVT
jgi:3-oxoacyl-[acyl-carrier protein] reductase